MALNRLGGIRGLTLPTQTPGMDEDELQRVKREQTARRMQAFYEPGYFGGGTSYGEQLPFANTLPTTMGGFEFTRDNPNLPQAPGLPTGTSDRLSRDYETRQLFDRPPIGMANLNRYGMGQLKNYGMGALAAYAPLARESDLRWR